MIINKLMLLKSINKNMLKYVLNVNNINQLQNIIKIEQNQFNYFGVASMQIYCKIPLSK